MTTQDLIKKSMLYERAYGKLNEILITLQEQRRADRRYAKTVHEEPDESYDLVYDELSKVRFRFRNFSDDLWCGAERNGLFAKESIEELLSAVVLRAANDYEMAVSGEKNEKEMQRIEQFAEEDASGFARIAFPKVLETIREAQPKFAKTARENFREIMAETEANRRKKKADNSGNKHRCPLCGGGLFTQSVRGTSDHMVCCTGCYLREVIPTRRERSFRK